MKSLEAQQCTWAVAKVEDIEQLTGTLSGTYTRAECLGGEQTDENYIVETTVKPVACQRVGVIVGYYWDIDWKASFIECILDVQNKQLRIDLILGSERTNIGTRPFEGLALGTEYKVKVELKTATDTSATIIFTVSDVNQLMIEDIDPLWSGGFYGFSIEGSLVTDNAVFSEHRKYSVYGRYSTLERVKDILLITVNDFNEALAEIMATADATVDARLTKANLTAVSTNELIKESSAFFAAWLYRRRNDPAGAEAFKAEAELLLTEYISSTVSVSGATGFRVGEAQ